jgi:hypothetical protein
MCNVLKGSQSGCYRWKQTNISKKNKKMNLVKQKITAIYFESKQRYGSPRITIELNALRYKISRSTVAKYMNK